MAGKGRRITREEFNAVKALQSDGFRINTASKTAGMTWTTVRRIYDTDDYATYTRYPSATAPSLPPTELVAASPKSGTTIEDLEAAKAQIVSQFDSVIATMKKLQEV